MFDNNARSRSLTLALTLVVLTAHVLLACASSNSNTQEPQQPTAPPEDEVAADGGPTLGQTADFLERQIPVFSAPTSEDKTETTSRYVSSAEDACKGTLHQRYQYDDGSWLETSVALDFSWFDPSTLTAYDNSVGTRKFSYSVFVATRNEAKLLIHNQRYLYYWGDGQEHTKSLPGFRLTLSANSREDAERLEKAVRRMIELCAPAEDVF